MENPLVGILLVSETNSNRGSHLGLVNIPSTSRNSQTLNDFRHILTNALSHLPNRNLIFVTPNGWEISSMMESTVILRDMISSDGIIKVRISYAKPKYGITVEGYGEKSIPAGFLFCDSDTNIVKLKDEIKDQLPSLYQFLLTVKFAFLDLNGWPISKQQEKLITVLEIAALNIVRIQCSRSLSQAEGYQQHSIEYNKSSSIENQLETMDIISSSILQPIAETMECDNVDHALEKTSIIPDMNSLHTMTSSGSFEILISYVHTEASSYALLLKTALEEHGYSVFIDVHCIKGGTDWQDALNDAISNCSLFLPLITPQYGKTLWTNREIKLADVLSKIIIPLNFLSTWPPKCLAIQFATTQYVSGLKDSCDACIPTDVDYAVVMEAAANISSRYAAEKISGRSFEVVEESETTPSRLSSREDTVPVMDDALSDKSSMTSLCLPDSPLLLKRRTTIRSYASVLPTTVDASFRETITKLREGKPLIVISSAPQQKEFSHNLAYDLQQKEYETWCSCDVNPEDGEDNARVIFQQKADEAGAVIFILSEEFGASSFCEQQVYYCEQRKRIIPVIFKPIQLPSWMAMLIGTSSFISCQSISYKTALFERIDALFNPQKADIELKEILKQKIDIANMCSQLSEQLPKGKLVYISGGTQFYSKNGKKICEELGKELAKDDEIVIISGGFYGVGETVSKSFYEQRLRYNKPHGVCHVVAVKDREDKSNQTRQNADLTFSPVPFGDTLFFGNSVRQREMLTPKVIDLCILIEGGPGAAFEAQQFVWNSNRVIPVKVTGGAAGGMFNVPSSVFNRPPKVQNKVWSMLSDSNATPTDIASAVFKIVQAVKNPLTLARSRLSSIGDRKLRKKVSIGRSDTMPCIDNDCDPITQELKRTLSEKRKLTKKHKPHSIN